MADDTVMADGARNQSGKSSASERRAWSAATSFGARQRRSPAVARVRSFRASGVSLPREGVPARSICRNSRDHDPGHFEAATANRGTSPEICEKQWSDDRGYRNRRVACLSAYSKKAWLSRIEEAAHFESISHIHLIACSRRSSRRLMKFWFPVANARSVCAGRSLIMRMAAIYARVSSEQQREENTIASQTASLIEFANKHELEVPKEWVFEDEGYSGATLERPGLERVRDLATEGQIQVVLAFSPDR